MDGARTGFPLSLPSTYFLILCRPLELHRMIKYISNGFCGGINRRTIAHNMSATNRVGDQRMIYRYFMGHRMEIT